MAIFNTVPPLAAGAGIKFDGERISTAAAPRNLLDNSDFRNPVNQRGATSKDTTGYFIDRWIIQNIDTTASIDENGMNVYSDSDNLIYQRISEGVEVGKVYTFAVGLSDGTVGVMSFELTTTTSSFAWLKLPLKVTSALSIGIGHSATIPLFVAFTNSQNSVIRTIWAALYEGEYTAATLPEYHPKGYAAELAGCQRYYYRRNLFCVLHPANKSNLSDYRGEITFPVEMRTNPQCAFDQNEGNVVTGPVNNQFCLLVGTPNESGWCATGSRLEFIADL